MARTIVSSGNGSENGSGIGLFLLLTLLLSGIFYALIIGTGQMGAGRGMYVLGLMWCPGVAAILTCRLRCEGLERLGWRWGEWRWHGPPIWSRSPIPRSPI